MGRHKKIDCFYLCQTYAHVPKHLVRDNVNFLAIFRQDEVNLNHIYYDHVNTDMTYIQFKELCSKWWRDGKHGFDNMADLQREKNVLRQLVKARDAIKRKYRILKFGKANAEKILSQTLKPIFDPLQQLVAQ